MEFRRLSVCLAVVGASLLARSSEAAPVEYVRICNDYGASFYYVPGTDTCFNPITGELRTHTEFGPRIEELAAKPRWVGNADKVCDRGVRVDLPARGPQGFAYLTSTSSILKSGGAPAWKTSGDQVVIPAGMYVESIYMRGALNGVSARNTVSLKLVIDETTALSAMLPSPRGASIFAVASPPTTYVNETGQDTTVTAYFGHWERSWGVGAPGQTLADYLMNVAADGTQASASEGPLSVVAKNFGTAGNALRFELRADATSPGVTVDNSDPTVVVAHYQPGVDDFAALQLAMDAVADSLPLAIFLDPGNTTDLLSDVFVDIAILHLRGGKEAPDLLAGELQVGMCLRALTEPTEAMNDSAATASLAASTTVAALEARIAALEAFIATTPPMGPQGEMGAPGTSGKNACASSEPGDMTLALLAVAFVLRRRRLQPR